MLSKEDVDAHSVFVEIGEGREVGESYVDCYLQTENDVLKTLSNQFDEDFIREGCSMSVKIADMIDDIDIGLGQPNQMPEVKIEENLILILIIFGTLYMPLLIKNSGG